MNEQELAEKFNKELDGLLTGLRPGHSLDQAAMDLSSALAGTDFSGDSLVKDTLRARLMRGSAPRAGLVEVIRGLLSNNYARAALAAACLAVALLPLARRAPAPAADKPPARPVETARVQPVDIPSGEALMPPPPAMLGLKAASKPDAGLFARLPMPRLEGERISEFPIKSAGGGTPIVIEEGREIQVENGSGIAWETDTAVFELRRQVTSVEEMFQVRSL